MRTNPFVDAWIFLTGNTDEHRASGVGWLLTALFLALLVASIWIAWVNWRRDPAQRTKEHVATWFMSAGKSLGLDGLIARSQGGPFAGDGFFARAYRKLA